MIDENIKRTRATIKRIRTIYWFQGVRICTGVPTAYAVERLIEPEGFRQNNAGKYFHSNKWASYRHGLTTPRAALVVRANGLVPGSAKELDHVLWKALDVSSNVLRDGPGWLRQLAPGLQLLVFTEDDQVCTYGGRHFFAKLERLASLDALACLTILLRMNLANGEFAQAWTVAASTFRVLLMLGAKFKDRGLADAIFSLYVEQIFSLSKWDGQCFYLEKYDFCLWAGVLYNAAKMGIADKGCPPSWTEEVQQMIQILEGKKGLHIKFLFDPITGPDHNLGPLSATAQLALDSRVSLRKSSMDEFQPRNTFEV
jgi:hypothetical protein